MTATTAETIAAGRAVLAHEIATDLRQIRAAISAADAAIDEVEAAPATDDEIRQHAAGVVERAGERARGALGVGLLGAPDAAGRLNEIDEFLSNLAAFEVAALVDPSKLSKALVAAAIGSRVGEPASGAEKRSRRAELEGEIQDLGRAEESIVRSAELAGLAILRRGDADPAAVLRPDDEDAGR